MHTPSKNHPIPVVVYGTLRTGGTLKSFYFPGLQGDTVTIVDHAVMYNDAIPYPFLVHAPGEQGRGEVYWVTDPQVLARVRAMEESAGYLTDWVSVRSDSHDVEFQALAFVWPTNSAFDVDLQPVPGGDWIAHANREGVAL